MKKTLLTLDIILSKEIKYMLKEQGFCPGDKLPSERELAAAFGVQRLTVRSALNLLLADNTIIAKPRSGYYMAPGRILVNTRDFPMDYRSAQTGQPLESVLLTFRKRRAGLALSGKMMLPEDTVVYQVNKLFSDQGKPLCLGHMYLPQALYPNLTREQAGSHSAGSLLTAEGQTAIAKSNQKITLVYANETEARLLSLSPGSPLMKYKGLMYDTSGRLAAFFEQVMLVGSFAFLSEGPCQAPRGNAGNNTGGFL